jgi:von Willebrand factor type A domain
LRLSSGKVMRSVPCKVFSSDINQGISMSIRKRMIVAATAALFSLAGNSHAAIVADIMWIVDTSGSMGDDIAQVKQRIAQFDSVMVANNIDARYGLVRFGGAPSLIQDFTDIGTFTAVGSPFTLLTDNGGGTEDGSLALQTALTGSYRANSVRNLILVTDEDDDNAGNRAALATDLAGTAANELINIIGNPNDDSNNYYRDLAPANGGAFFDISSFRANPAPFFTNFINTKVNEIIQDFCTVNPNDPACLNKTPEPMSAALVGLGLVGMGALRRRRHT